MSLKKVGNSCQSSLHGESEAERSQVPLPGYPAPGDAVMGGLGAEPPCSGVGGSGTNTSAAWFPVLGLPVTLWSWAGLFSEAVELVGQSCTEC